MNPSVTKPAAAEPSEREMFEAWYVTHAFDYAKHPIGTRDCAKQWEAWQARAALKPAVPEPEPVHQVEPP